MDIRILGSGSSGNCYWVSDGTTPLLLEAGLPIRKIREGLDFKLSDVAACLITHEHGDHAKAALDLLKAGTDVYASGLTLGRLDLQGHRARHLAAKVTTTIGTWRVTPFAAIHDAAEPLCFVLDSTATGERLLYSGDTGYITPRIAGLTHIIIEANNDWERVREGSAPASLKARIVGTHMSIETVKAFLAANDMSRVQAIYLVHLSNGNSDAEGFRREVQELTGKEVIVG